MPGPTAPRAVLETALYASDLDAAAAFYKDVVGLTEHQRVPGRHVFLRCETSMLMLFNPQATQSGGGKLPVPPHGARGEGHVCFRAEPGEMDAWAHHLSAMGVAIEADFEWPNGARSIYVRDPARNSVEFAEAKLWDFDT
ncbi:glyoxalase/bleomycin resistance/extradiol dioxygenase family protein [Pelagivirga sediminicola]|uniref:Glyoxalase/bleomycin resistance/extradiol dioxygenase family protein n=1 Tax=Pelagivirga sediminicola TaxID=2170575 RepID=A0A2T7G4S6_9RHOB|nr:VOC family protein [Pelagivirga sediminicola]PVA09419.1 glyoxalase/bleomycin resistance/extradiol dioxygenase family protein [Pelagivirga sediminicola]